MQKGRERRPLGGSGEGVDQAADHLVGGLGDHAASLGLDLAGLEGEKDGGEIGRLLRVGAGNRAAGDFAGGLLDHALAGLDGAKTGAEGTTLDFHGGYRSSFNGASN